MSAPVVGPGARSNQDTGMLWANNSASRLATRVSTIPKRFNSPQRVKAKCFTVFASTFGCVELPSTPISTNSAPADSPPPPQIISASASILSLVETVSFAWVAGSAPCASVVRKYAALAEGVVLPLLFSAPICESASPPLCEIYSCR